MHITAEKLGKIESINEETLVVGVFAKQLKNGVIDQIDKIADGTIKRFLDKKEKFGKLFETAIFHIPASKHKSIEKVVIVGLGKIDELDRYKIRQLGGFVGKSLARDVASFAIYLPQEVGLEKLADVFVVGLAGGVFDPGHHKSEKDEKSKKKEADVVLLSADLIDKKLIDQGLMIGETLNKVREVVNQPANVATPEYMVKFAKRVAAENSLKIEVFSEKQVNEMGMGIMASVARGSEEDLYFVVMRYLGAGSAGPTLAIVGKGITFDSGGISIKPADSMEWMKMDMAGAAACFGAMEVIGKLKPKINVVCVCPLTENLISGKASKPGDVAKGLAGKTVEIINTDAEG
ncbi:hypothetical protein HY024_02410, partial [Candidatus Curtissbacteria bacterium]|nr:hypothetical protein [Candidatus Curtissbacteria bacterium]